MANEITLSGSLKYSDAVGAVTEIFTNFLQATTATTRFTRIEMSIAITDTALVLGNLTALGYGFFINHDVTNTVYLRIGAAGNRFGTLPPGGIGLFYFGPDNQAPYAIALNAPCLIEYVICNQ